MLGDLKRRLPLSVATPLKRGYRAIRRNVRRRRRNLASCRDIRAHGLRILTAPVLFRAKSSEVLFVLGTGSSINRLTEAQWRHIEAGDSIGLNTWILHPHVPTFYSGEIPYYEDELPSESLLPITYRHNLRIAAPRYRKCVSFFRLRDEVLANGDIVREFGGRVALQEFVGASGVDDFNQRIERYDLRRRGFVTRMLHQASSVDSSVMLAAYLRYKRVVLCGVDLNDIRYFWEEDQERFTSVGFRIPDPGQRGVIHRTNDPSQTPSGVPVGALLNRLRSHPQMPEIFVAHKGSALYPDIPLYDWPA